MVRSAVTFLAFVSLLTGGANAASWAEERAIYAEAQRAAAAQIEKLLSQAESVELVSLGPFPPFHQPEDSGDHVGRFRVRQRAVIKERGEIPEIIATLRGSVIESVDEAFPKDGRRVFPVSCFMPQHGFRVLCNGKEVHILVCYLCRNGVIAGLNDTVVEFQISKSSRDSIEGVFLRSGLPPSDKAYPKKD